MIKKKGYFDKTKLSNIFGGSIITGQTTTHPSQQGKRVTTPSSRSSSSSCSATASSNNNDNITHRFKNSTDKREENPTQKKAPRAKVSIKRWTGKDAENKIRSTIIHPPSSDGEDSENELFTIRKEVDKEASPIKQSIIPEISQSKIKNKKKRTRKCDDDNESPEKKKVDFRLDAMKNRLEAGRFRYLNEMLYTSTSKEAMKAFKQDPSSFDVYHRGYRGQIEKWPVKPIDRAVQFVNRRPKTDVIADMGCGEAILALRVKQIVNSFDLKALNDRVTVSDISHVPLRNESVNVVVFCLSLMGTNLGDFIKEAGRILVKDGILWIAEVASRFSGDLDTFSQGISQYGFKCTACNTEATHFVTLTFKKAEISKKSSGKLTPITLAPCLYKKR